MTVTYCEESCPRKIHPQVPSRTCFPWSQSGQAWWLLTDRTRRVGSHSYLNPFPTSKTIIGGQDGPEQQELGSCSPSEHRWVLWSPLSRTPNFWQTWGAPCNFVRWHTRNFLVDTKAWDFMLSFSSGPQPQKIATFRGELGQLRNVLYSRQPVNRETFLSKTPSSFCLHFGAELVSLIMR